MYCSFVLSIYHFFYHSFYRLFFRSFHLSFFLSIGIIWSIYRSSFFRSFVFVCIVLCFSFFYVSFFLSFFLSFYRSFVFSNRSFYHSIVLSFFLLFFHPFCHSFVFCIYCSFVLSIYRSIYLYIVSIVLTFIYHSIVLSNILSFYQSLCLSLWLGLLALVICTGSHWWCWLKASMCDKETNMMYRPEGDGNPSICHSPNAPSLHKNIKKHQVQQGIIFPFSVPIKHFWTFYRGLNYSFQMPLHCVCVCVWKASCFAIVSVGFISDRFCSFNLCCKSNLILLACSAKLEMRAWYSCDWNLHQMKDLHPA